ncbi:MAG: glycine cleavage system protein GcvH [Kiritimatiellaeota bacterium]|nr:glycine cleavage system protein GcvH [Kiritimatiellota bacterium]
MKRFSEDHVWVDYRAGSATVGLSTFAVAETGPLVFVDLPEQGAVLAPGDVLCVVESSKAAVDVLCPVAGTVVEVNSAVAESPELVSSSPEGDGWLCRLGEVDPTDLDSLLTEAEYDRFLTAEEDDG